LRIKFIMNQLPQEGALFVVLLLGANIISLT